MGWGQQSYSPSFSKPSLPDEDGDDKNSSQDEEGKDPKGHQDSHLLQGVTAIWDRQTVTAEGCHSPQHLGTYGKLLDTHTHRLGARDPSCCSQPYTWHSCPPPLALLTYGLRVGSLGGLLSQALRSGICSGFFTCCGGQVWKNRRDGNTYQKHMQHPRDLQRGAWKGIFVPQRSHESHEGTTEGLMVLWKS